MRCTKLQVGQRSAFQLRALIPRRAHCYSRSWRPPRSLSRPGKPFP